MRNARKIVLGTIALAAIFALVASAPAFGAVTIKQKKGENEYKWQFYGFSQLEARGGEGRGSGESVDNGDLYFRAQRIRIGTRYIYKNVASKLFLDFNQSFTDKSGGLPKAVKDAFVSYKFSHAAFVRIGMIKTPVGMNFTIPGWNLDNIERNRIDKALVLERDMGIMLSGRLIGGRDDNPMRKKINGTEMGHERQGYGWGYDIGIFNPAERSGAVKALGNQTVTADLDGDGTAVSGTANLGFTSGDGSLAYTARLHYDHGTMFHGEISWGQQIDAGGTDTQVTLTDGTGGGTPVSETIDVRTEDYTIYGLGMNWFLLDEMLNIKFEYLSGESIRGEDGRDQQAYSLMVGYRFTPKVEGIFKHYQGSAERRGFQDADLGNTYLGVNFYLDPLSFSPRSLQSHKLCINYVIPSGDDDKKGDVYFPAVGTGGYTEDAFLLQYQVKY